MAPKELERHDLVIKELAAVGIDPDFLAISLDLVLPNLSILVPRPNYHLEL